jgi:sporulation protein YlmC with PRC-barrel domain
MMTDDALHGRAVLTTDGVNLGALEHLLVDTPQLRVSGVEIRIRKEIAERLGVPYGLLRGPTLQIPIEQVQSIGDVVLLSVHVDALSRKDQADSVRP